jgi:hypothetical protein
MVLISERPNNYTESPPLNHVSFVIKAGQAVKPALLRVTVK